MAAPVGYFGASTGAGAALVAAAARPELVRAVVSRGGRPDLADPDSLHHVRAPTLLIVGSLDTDVLALNRAAAAELSCDYRISVVPGAGHLFEEPGTLEAVVGLAADWFGSRLGGGGAMMFRDRADAGRQLARRLEHLRGTAPVVLALPRGGVPVGFEIATALDAPLDLLLVRKIGAPGFPELAVGAVVDGAQPETVINEEIVQDLNVSPAYIAEATARELEEIERRRALYLRGRSPVPLRGRSVILVDDGIATGATVRVALQALARVGAARRVLAAPVAPPESAQALRPLCDEAVFLAEPARFRAVGAFYDDFRQTEDDEVIALLDRAAARAATPADRLPD